ncbi:hypothetical protein KIW84_062222, partial [Lathyrus oleraceus]
KLRYPEAKTPVARRKNKESEALRISILLSGLMIKRLGSGGLKLGGGEIEIGDGSCCVVTEDEEFSPDMALMQILVVCGLFLGNGRGLWIGNWERLRVPDPAMAVTLELGGEVKSVRK